MCVKDLIDSLYGDEDPWSLDHVKDKREKAVKLKELVRESEANGGCDLRLKRFKEEQYRLAREL
jgi:hypothetical protein